MVKRTPTLFGHGILPELCHSIAKDDPKLVSQLKVVYPQFGLFMATRELSDKIVQKSNLSEQEYIALPFLARDAFAACKAFATDPKRGEHHVQPEDLIFKIIDIYNVRLYVVMFHISKMPRVIGFWQHPGIGVSTRLADFLIPHVDSAQELPPLDSNRVGVEDDEYYLAKPTFLLDSPVHAQLRERIVSLLKRAPAPNPPTSFIPPSPIVGEQKLLSDDVYLFHTGMAAIYRLHQWLNAANYNEYKSVAFGRLHHSTTELLRHYGAGYEPFSQGDESDLLRLEAFLEAEQQAECKVQALYVEMPSSPVLTSAPLTELRRLADRFEFILVVDDTVGGFANVDFLSVADVLVTSLTESFSGDADVMGGSLVLNPFSPAYRNLKPLVRNHFHTELFVDDAIVLERQSRDYLERCAILNRNAQAVAAFLHSRSQDPASAVTNVLYPTVSPAQANIEPYLRAPSPEFPSPGYGGLLFVDFEHADYMKVFYAALQVYMGPHLGAHLTLGMPHNEIMFGKPPAVRTKAEEYGWGMNQIKISVGLEDVAELVSVFEDAVGVADALKRERA